MELKTAIIQPLKFVVTGEKKTKTYKLVFDYRAIARANEALSKDILKIAVWGPLWTGQEPKPGQAYVKPEDLPVIIWAAMAKYHPEVPVEEVMDIIVPNCQKAYTEAIMDRLFPGIFEEYTRLVNEALSPKAQAPSGQV